MEKEIASCSSYSNEILQVVDFPSVRKFSSSIDPSLLQNRTEHLGLEQIIQKFDAYPKMCCCHKFDIVLLCPKLGVTRLLSILELSEYQGNGDTKPPIFSIKSMRVSVPFLSKEATGDQVWNIAMSIENPNLGADISYDQGVVYASHGNTELWKTHMKAFNLASWGYRLSGWKHVSPKSLTNSPAASSIREEVAHDGSGVFRVLVQTMIRAEE